MCCVGCTVKGHMACESCTLRQHEQREQHSAAFAASPPPWAALSRRRCSTVGRASSQAGSTREVGLARRVCCACAAETVLCMVETT
jgi:hypothetical protein